jgi:hypothetical protein
VEAGAIPQVFDLKKKKEGGKKRLADEGPTSIRRLGAYSLARAVSNQIDTQSPRHQTLHLWMKRTKGKQLYAGYVSDLKRQHLTVDT